MKKQINVFTVTRQKKIWVGGSGFFLFYFFIQLNCTFLAVIMLHQHEFASQKAEIIDCHCKLCAFCTFDVR